jgi:hypothetical protein
MALGSTQHLSTRNISWGKGGRCVGLTTLPFHVPNVLKSLTLNLLEPSGSVKACNGIALPLLYNLSKATCFDPLTRSSSVRGWSIYNHPRPDDPFRGSKHIALIKLYNTYSNIFWVVFDGSPLSQSVHAHQGWPHLKSSCEIFTETPAVLYTLILCVEIAYSLHFKRLIFVY